MHASKYASGTKPTIRRRCASSASSLNCVRPALAMLLQAPVVAAIAAVLLMYVQPHLAAEPLRVRHLGKAKRSPLPVVDMKARNPVKSPLAMIRDTINNAMATLSAERPITPGLYLFSGLELDSCVLVESRKEGERGLTVTANQLTQFYQQSLTAADQTFTISAFIEHRFRHLTLGDPTIFMPVFFFFFSHRSIVIDFDLTSCLFRPLFIFIFIFIFFSSLGLEKKKNRKSQIATTTNYTQTSSHQLQGHRRIYIPPSSHNKSSTHVSDIAALSLLTYAFSGSHAYDLHSLFFSA
jgi:hypothetical protein